jgi:hypothetical protein
MDRMHGWMDAAAKWILRMPPNAAGEARLQFSSGRCLGLASDSAPANAEGGCLPLLQRQLVPAPLEGQHLAGGCIAHLELGDVAVPRGQGGRGQPQPPIRVRGRTEGEGSLQPRAGQEHPVVGVGGGVPFHLQYVEF